MNVIAFQEITNPPISDCRVVVMDNEGNITSGYFSKENGYDLRDKTITPAVWCYNGFDKKSIVTNSKNMKAIQIDDPVSEKAYFYMVGFNIKLGYNLEIIKTEEDVAKMADGVGQYFYEDCIKTIENFRESKDNK